MNLTLSEIFTHGGGTMWVVVAFSVIALAIAVERAIVQWRVLARARDLTSTVVAQLGRGDLAAARKTCDGSSSPIADVFLIGFQRVDGKARHLGPAVHRERLRVTSALRTRQWMLATIGATVPFIGLYGTVVGIMDAMGRFDSNATVTMGMVAGPLSLALVVTAAAILVAVEGVILYNYFNQRVAAIGAEFKLLTDEFLEELIEAAATPTAIAPADKPAKASKAKADKADGATQGDDGDR